MALLESVGLLLYRVRAGELEVLLAHMGGPLWSNKERSWTVPKGLRDPSDESLLATAEREFAEELGTPAPSAPSHDLGTVRSTSKTVYVFAREADFDSTSITSNTFEMEWPPRSGRRQSFPEVDRAAWFTLADAEPILVASQVPFLQRVAALVR